MSHEETNSNQTAVTVSRNEVMPSLSEIDEFTPVAKQIMEQLASIQERKIVAAMVTSSARTLA